MVQTEDSIHIFSVDVLTSSEAHDDVRSPRVYPLGENRIARVIQPNCPPTIFELETLREVHPDTNASPLDPPSAELDIFLSAWKEAGEGALLGGSSPRSTWFVTLSGSNPQWLRITNLVYGNTALKIITGDELGAGEVYGVAFGSGARFYLKVDGPGRHVRIPCDAIWRHPHQIAFGDPEPLSEPRAIPPYTIDANCEWVLDGESRKICWISPADIRRGKGGHFWAGLSLIMVGDDGVVKKLTFKDLGTSTVHM